jgi:hypothetical protein
MHTIHVRFVISELSEDDIQALRNADVIISKMILTPDDFRLFHYRTGDTIEVENQDGNRLWCRIQELEVVDSNEQVILIFTLRHIDAKNIALT